MSAPELELIVGHVYSAKRPNTHGFNEPLLNDRQIVWIGIAEVQYDSPSVGFGRTYPKVSHDAFRRWAKEDITGQMPANGEWRIASATLAAREEPK